MKHFILSKANYTKPYVRTEKGKAIQVKGHSSKPGIWNREFSLDFPRDNAELNTKMARMMIKQGMTPEAVIGAFPKVFKMIQTDSGARQLGMRYDIKLPDGGKDISERVSVDDAKKAIQRFKRGLTLPKGDPTGWNNPVREAEYQEYLKQKKLTEYKNDYGVKVHTKAEYKQYLDELKQEDEKDVGIELEKLRMVLGKSNVKHVIIKKGFRMARGERGEEEAEREKKRKKRENDYTPGEERFKERAKERREDY